MLTSCELKLATSLVWQKVHLTSNRPSRLAFGVLKACGSYSKRYSRTKAEQRSNERTRGEGKRGFSLCRLPLALSPSFSHFDLGSSLSRSRNSYF